MTLDEFTTRIETDRTFREHICSAAFAGTLTEDEECHLLDIGLGPPPRKWATTRRTTPWPTLLVQLYHEHRARPFPMHLALARQPIADAFAIRNEAQRRLTDPKWRDLRDQLRDVIQCLDEAFTGQVIGLGFPDE